MKPETLLQQLQQNPDFLKLTLAHPDFLPFVRYSPQNDTEIQVWDTGVIYCQPKQCGQQDIVLSSGVHGNETAPIELCSRAVKRRIGWQTIADRAGAVFIW